MSNIANLSVRTRGCVFLISVLTLTLQLLQARILSVIYWHHLVYFVITMGLLGMAASGTALSLLWRLRKIDEWHFYRFCLAGFSLSSLFSIFLVSRLAFAGNFFASAQNFSTLLRLASSYVLLMLPYFFFGLLISGAFFRNPDRSGCIYFFNLIGSAIGCLFYVLLIGPLAAQNLLLLIFIVGLLPEVFCVPRRVPVRLLVIIIVAACFWWGHLSLRFLPERNKQYWTLFENRKVEFTEWNTISRVDVISNSIKDEGYKRIVVDGDAQTPMIEVDLRSLNPDSLLYIPRDFVYILSRKRIPERSLVIGPGGGADVLTAYKYGVKEIDAVEINPSIVRIVTRNFSSYIGDIFVKENVNLFLEDGRSFVRRTHKKYDAIVLFGVDSLSALSSGAYVLMESYLYTLEAFSDYWSRLSEDGIIQISRWFYREKPRETLRAFITAYYSLRMNGVQNPSRHLLVLADSRTIEENQPFGHLFISKKPFEIEQLQALEKWLVARRLAFDLVYSPFQLEKGEIYQKPFIQFIQAATKAQEETFFRDYLFNVRPVTDDNPFFFQYGRWSHAFRPYTEPLGYFDSMQGRWPFLVLLMLLAQSVVLTILFVGWPFWKLKKKVMNLSIHFAIVGYFSLLGIGFMFMEMFFIQKCVLFLGHPMYSMAVTIPVLLIGAGCGSFSLERAWKNQKFLFVLLSSWVVMSVVLVLYTAAARALLQYSIFWRVIAVCLVIFPVGVFLGMPFPLVMRRLSTFPQLVPIAWAVNGGTSVISSVAAIILAMTCGFKFLIILVVTIYLLAFLCFKIWNHQIHQKGIAG